jgi:hypothetical protein
MFLVGPTKQIPAPLGAAQISMSNTTMANTYTRIYIQVVFAVKGRANLITPAHKEELRKYIARHHPQHET